MVPAGTVAVVVAAVLNTTNLPTPAASTLKSIIGLATFPELVVEPMELIVPVTMSPRAALLSVKVPVLTAPAVVDWVSVAAVNAAVP